MENNNKTLISALVFTLVCLVLGGIFGALGYYWYAEKHKTEIPIVKPDISKELNEIDSLNYVVFEQVQEIERLKASLLEKKTVIIREIETIKECPADSNLDRMKENLLELGELTKDTPDSLPQLIQVPGEDSIRASLTVDNMRDVNIISAKYRNECEINEILNKEITADSIIINAKDSIIVQNSIIMDKRESEYEINMMSLQANLEKERRDKKIRTATLGTAAGVFAILAGAILIKK